MKLKTNFKMEIWDMKKVMFYAALLLALLALPAASAAAEGGLRVVATDFPCYDFARQVCGDGTDVTMLLKPGTEAHAYDPTPADILAIGDANLFVYIGGESDAWADGILASFDSDDRPATLRMMDCVSDLVEEDDADGHHHGESTPEYDEHIWTSPVNAAAMVRALGEAVAGLDGADADGCRQAAEAYAEQIEGIDGALRQLVEGAKRRNVVFADRFPFIYLAREYGLDWQAAFPSCTADTEPSAQTVMALIDRVISEGIPAVYTIELSTQAVAKTVAEETGAEILTLHSMQSVTQDEFEAGESYVSLMGRNLEALRRGLE